MKLLYTLAAALVAASAFAAPAGFKQVNFDAKATTVTAPARDAFEKVSNKVDFGAPVAEGKVINKKALDRQVVAGASKAPAKKASKKVGNVTVTTDDHGIITDVTGVESKMYTRSAAGLYLSYTNGSGWSYGYQSGNVEIVEDGDNVFMKDPIAKFNLGSWIQGTRRGDVITFPVGQPLYYVSNYATTLSLDWTSWADLERHSDLGDITFSVDGDVLTLEGTSSPLTDQAAIMLSITWDDDNTPYGELECLTVLTYDAGYVPPSTDLVELPAGLDVETWYMQAYDSTESLLKNVEVQVAFNRDEVYLAGVCIDFPDAWVKGTINGDVIEFESFQYVGSYSGSADIWLIGYTEDDGLCAPVAAYDAEARTMAFTCTLVENAATDRIYYLEMLDEVVISAEAVYYPEPVVLPAGATVLNWNLNAYSIDLNTNGYEIVANRASKVAFVGDKVYVSGLNSYLPDAWIEGTLEDGVITFPTGQYFGVFYSTYDMYCIGVGANGIGDIVAYYDADSKEIVFESEVAISLAPTPDQIVDYLAFITISEAKVEYLLTEETADLPYLNTFDSEEEQAQAVIYDANGDGKTFSFYTTAGNIEARYLYSTDNDGDDYIVFPGLLLKPGHKYVVKVDARCESASYPEKVEVVCGPEALVSALTTGVIAPTVISSNKSQTLANEEFTVDAEGYYFFAIHGISEADNYYLFVDNFSVEEAMIEVLWENSAAKFAAPHVHYSIDGGDSYEQSTPMEEWSEAVAAAARAAAEGSELTGDLEIWSAKVPATATHVSFSDAGANQTAGFPAIHQQLYDPNGTTGVENVAADAMMSAPEYFNLQGARIANPAAGQVVIEVRNGHASKVAF